MKLTTSQQHMIYNEIKICFSDLYYFDDIIATKLFQAIQNCNITEINPNTVDKIAERYFNKKLLRTTDQKLVWAQIRIIFKACYILILSTAEMYKSMQWVDIPTLLMHYPEFRDESVEELCLLLKFRNMLKIALQVIPAENHKNCLLKIAARLEGSRKEYITGGGSKPAVRRRELVFTRESGISPVKRPEGGRKKPQRNIDSNGCVRTVVKSSLSSFSIKKARLVRLASADIKVLGSPMDLFAQTAQASSSCVPRSPHTTPTSTAVTTSTQAYHTLPAEPPSYLSAYNWNDYNASADIFHFGSLQPEAEINYSSSYDMNYHPHHHHQPHHPNPHQHHHHHQNTTQLQAVNVIPTRPAGSKRALSVPIETIHPGSPVYPFDLQDLTGLTDLLGIYDESDQPPPPYTRTLSCGDVPIEQAATYLDNDGDDDLVIGELLSGFSDNPFDFEL